MNEETAATGLEIAVIGMAGRFPGAKNIKEFWKNLANGVEVISFLNDEEVEQAGVSREILKKPGFVKTGGGILEGTEYFDASFFNYTPAEAEHLAPQVRLFHECAYAALEDAAYSPDNFTGLIGLYTGVANDVEWQLLSAAAVTGAGEMVSLDQNYLNNSNFTSTLTSYKLNLNGPSVIIFSTCSTSLVSVHLACQGLLSGDCDMALAGGIALLLSKNRSYLYREGLIVSPDGHCRAFDARAAGSCGGDGVGIVVLKRLEDAVKDRDHIYAVIKGSAVNNDGIRKVGYSAPSVAGQISVIEKALKMAGVDPAAIGYVETHGTGTVLGDPIEVQALKLAFNTDKRNYCGLGSLKTNMGHMDTAAGIAGFLKTVLALYHKKIPPSLHFETANPGIDLENSPFYVNAVLKDWQNNGKPLCAGVSSFGIGGTNGHVVLEEWDTTPAAESQQETGQSSGHELLLLSAKSEAALDQLTENLAGYFKNNPGINLADAAYTLKAGRGQFQYRRKLQCAGTAGAAAGLTAKDPRILQTYHAKVDNRPVIFMFPGLGAQHVNMGVGLYETEPLFRREMDTCFALVEEITGLAIKDILYPGIDPNRAGQIPGRDRVTQYLIFIFEYALARLLMSWGIVPKAMVGYSFGEYAAACLSGVFSLENTLQLIAAREKLIGRLPPGKMLSVPLPLEELRPLLPAELSTAIDNGESVVVSGSKQAVDSFAKDMKAKKIICTDINTPYAVHSRVMDPILTEFARQVEKIPLQPPVIPFISSVTGDWIKPVDAVSPDYWVKQLRETVRFADSIDTMLREKNAVFVEVGPGRDLSMLLNRRLADKPDQHALNLITPPKGKIPGYRYFQNRIGLLWLYGVEIDWLDYYRGKERKRLSLPGYPFEKQRYWRYVDDYKAGKISGGAAAARKKSSKKLADWFYVPTWQRKENYHYPAAEKLKTQNPVWLVFGDSSGIGSRLVSRLKKLEQRVVLVNKAAAYAGKRDDEYEMNPAAGDDYVTLMNDLARSGLIPDRIVFLWAITAAGNKTGGNDRAASEEAVEQGLYSLVFLARALTGNRKFNKEIVINVAADGLHDILGGEYIQPGRAALISPCLVIPQEYPNLRCKCIDIPLPGKGKKAGDKLLEFLLKELSSTGSDNLVAWRGNSRWVRYYEPFNWQEIEKAPLLREEGVYLVIGGLGGIGYTLSEYLVEKMAAKVILVGREELPPPEMWGQALLLAEQTGKMNRCIQKLRRLEEKGGDVIYLPADIADKQRLEDVIAEAESRFGAINGLIHCAGIVGPEALFTIKDVTTADFHSQFQAKLYGLLVLDELLAGKKLDFCLLVSSISTVLGGLGFIAYAAANLIMNAAADRHNQTGREPWITVNWDGTSPEDTRAAFELIFSSRRIDRVIFSRDGDLEGRIERWLKFTAQQTGAEAAGRDSARLYSRPELTTPYEAPRNAAEKKLAEIWQNFLSVDKIGVHDDLFDLGGDSLKALNIISIISKELNITIPVREFFENSTIAGVAGYLQELEIEEHNPITHSEKREYYVLSPAQKRVYLLQQMDEQGTGYNSPMEFDLPPGINEKELKESFRQLVSRHESLRTSFALIAEEPVQRVHPEVDFKIELITTADAHIEAVKKGFIRPFDLHRPPLFRIGLITGDVSQKVLLMDIHHIVTDGISQGILVQEFKILLSGGELPQPGLQYKEYSRWQNNEKQRESIKEQEKYWLREFSGELPVLHLPCDYPRPPVKSFSGSGSGFYINEKETGLLNEIGRKYNATLFMTLLTVYNILLFKLSGQEDMVVGSPIAGRRHADLQHITGMFVNMLAVRNYPKAEKTFFDFLLEARSKILSCFENQEYQFEDLVDRISVRRSTDRNPVFDTVFILQNQSERSAAAPTPPLPGTTPGEGIIECRERMAKFDLTLECVETGRHIYCNFEYCTRLFKKETIARFIAYFRNIITAVCSNNELKLADFDILTEAERNRLLYEFNDTACEYPQDKGIAQLFADQAESTPDNIVVMGYGGGVGAKHSQQEQNGNASPQKSVSVHPGYLTYRKLNENANGLALLLREKGAAPGTTAGILMESSLEMIFAIIGVLKSGAAYMPMDPAYPEERIRYMLADSAARILLTGKELSSLPPGKGLLHINIAEPGIYRTASTSPEVINSPADLAYIIYTSGSTGFPKGVEVEHKGVVNMLLYRKEQYGMDAGVTALQLFSYAFDGFITGFFTPVIAGGKVILLRNESLKDIAEIVRNISVHKVTHFISIPPLFKAILDTADRAQLSSLKAVTLAGDQLQPELISQAKEKNPRMEIVNEYGVTELSVMSTIYRHQEKDALVKIGVPVANTGIYILDKWQKLLAPGIPGELTIGGQGVARGYLNNPELTAEKFVDFASGGQGAFLKNRPLHPQKTFVDEQDRRGEPCVRPGSIVRRGEPCVRPGSIVRRGEPCVRPSGKTSVGAQRAVPSRRAVPGELLYKTGDLARWLPDGNIELSGRIDNQVKVRGFRIELGEIENRLLKIAGIRAAVVVDRQDEAGRKYLCAYIIMNEDGKSKAAALSDSRVKKIREELSQHLPAYYVPAYFKQIEKIPLTLNGKVDRRVLPEPGITAAADYKAPASERERKMAALWAEVLNMKKENISVDADFFQLGGHSLNAFVLVSRIFKEFQVKIPLVDFFKMPVVSELTAYISRAEVIKYVPVKPAEKRDYYALSPAQKRMYILNKMSAVKTGYNLPQVIFLREDVEPTRLEAAAAALINRHAGLRTSFLIVENEPVQKIHERVNFSIQPIKEVKPVDSGTGGDISAAAQRILTGFVKPFDLSRAPILRAGLIKTGGQVNILLFDSHHIISDGSSQEILENEFLALYNGETLPALKLQYTDFVSWQQSREQQELKNRQEKYWLDRFSKELPMLTLPCDYPRPLTRSFTGAAVGVLLNEQETAAIKQRAAENEATLFMILLTVFNILLAKISGREDIVIGVDTAGRNREELHNIIGMFVNVLPLRNFPAGKKTFRDFLKEVKEETLAAFENQDYQFEDLVDKISLNRDISRNPIFDVVFSMQNQAGFREDAGNLNNEKGLIHKEGTAKFDLNLAAVDLGKNLYLAFEYCTDLFKAATIDRFILYLKNIIHRVSENPDIEILEIEMVGSSESVESLKKLHCKREKVFVNKEKEDKTKKANLEADFDF